MKVELQSHIHQLLLGSGRMDEYSFHGYKPLGTNKNETTKLGLHQVQKLSLATMFAECWSKNERANEKAQPVTNVTSRSRVLDTRNNYPRANHSRTLKWFWQICNREKRDVNMVEVQQVIENSLNAPIEFSNCTNLLSNDNRLFSSDES